MTSTWGCSGDVGSIKDVWLEEGRSVKWERFQAGEIRTTGGLSCGRNSVSKFHGLAGVTGTPRPPWKQQTMLTGQNS